jgi:hypothetical protein
VQFDINCLDLSQIGMLNDILGLAQSETFGRSTPSTTKRKEIVSKHGLTQPQARMVYNVITRIRMWNNQNDGDQFMAPIPHAGMSFLEAHN